MNKPRIKYYLLLPQFQTTIKKLGGVQAPCGYGMLAKRIQIDQDELVIWWLQDNLLAFFGVSNLVEEKLGNEINASNGRDAAPPVQSISKRKSRIFGLGIQIGFLGGVSQVTFIPRNDEGVFLGEGPLLAQNLWLVLFCQQQAVCAVPGMFHPDNAVLFEYQVPPHIEPGTQLALKVFHRGVDVTPKQITLTCAVFDDTADYTIDISAEDAVQIRDLNQHFARRLSGLLHENFIQKEPIEMYLDGDGLLTVRGTCELILTFETQKQLAEARDTIFSGTRLSGIPFRSEVYSGGCLEGQVALTSVHLDDNPS